MNTYHINKGIGNTVEFKGLKTGYLFVFASGLLIVLLLIIILYMADINPYVCLFLGITSGSILIWKTFALNKKYGEHGLMKLWAKRKHPRYIIRRKPIGSLIRFDFKRL
ncbi:TPA: DUF4133 domain-containing protein [Elizabethkingia anophelis]